MCFFELIGYDGSLKRVIKRCTEAFNYPPNGLSFVIYGNEGTGKKSLAKLICKHSILSKGILDKDAKIVEYDLSVVDPLSIHQAITRLYKCKQTEFAMYYPIAF